MPPAVRHHSAHSRPRRPAAGLDRAARAVSSAISNNRRAETVGLSSTVGPVDASPLVIAQQGRAEAIDASPVVVAQRKRLETVFGEPGRPDGGATGLPGQLRSSVESLSGLSMDHVRVHYNSSRPAQLDALAYTQGTDIHVAPGQEHHLPHEAWHAVQQAQGRVRPTDETSSGTPINDAPDLEREADAMGARAMALRASPLGAIRSAQVPAPGAAAIQRLGGEKKDVKVKKGKDKADPPEFAEGEKLLSAARAEATKARRQKKDDIFGTIPAKGVTKHYGGGLQALDDLQLLAATPQFTGPAPHLLIRGDEVLYQPKKAADAEKEPDPLPIATITPRGLEKLEAQPAEARRDLFSAGGAGKTYVKDVRDVPTRRYAYVEKNYWQFMEFLTRNRLEGRYQNYFRAANPGTARPPVTGVRESESKMIRRKNKGPLTHEQLAMLHQWKGSGLQQRGLSLTSTPRKGQTVGNSGDNFRTKTGVRLTIDLARIPTGPEAPMMINHYAHGGVKDVVPRTVSSKYDYIESVIKNRELFLEFVRPEWIVDIEFHTPGAETHFARGDSTAEEMMQAARAGSGYDKFAAGFAAGVKGGPLSDADKGDPDYCAGVAFAEEYQRGHEAGSAEAEVKKVGDQPVDPLTEIQGFDPKKQKDVYAIGRIHGRVRRPKAADLAGVWS